MVSSSSSPNSPKPLSADTVGNESLDAIYALNIGDFVVESFISDALLEKISNRLAASPERLRMQLEELVDIYALDRTLSILGFEASDDFVIYDSIASTLASMFGVDACHLFQPAKKDVAGYYLSLTGTSLDIATNQRWNIGLPVRDDDLLGQCFLDASQAVVDNLGTAANQTGGTAWHPIEPLNQHHAQAVLMVPMVGSGHKHVQGVLCLESYQPRVFHPTLVALAHAASNVFVCSIQLQQWIAEAKTALANDEANMDKLQTLRAQITECIGELGLRQQSFVETLGQAIDARQQYTEGHSQRVAELARDLAYAFELNEKTVDCVYYAGLLGNIGKLHVPKQVLQKQESLNKEEWEQLHNHANAGVALLSQLHILADTLPYVTYQAERWNGHGSPHGLSGNGIPFGSRLLAVADAFEALVHERPYRDRAYSETEAVGILKKEAGTKWDPQVVEKLTAKFA